MSALQKLPRIAGIAGVGASAAALATQPAIRAYISRTLGLQAPGGTWRALALLLVLLNLKSLPFVWHVSCPIKRHVHLATPLRNER